MRTARWDSLVYRAYRRPLATYFNVLCAVTASCTLRAPRPEQTSMTDEEEYVLLSLPEVFVYKVPPRTSAQGHK
jgi:hypothetical protein